ncbi:MAG: hydrogenase maturation [Geobacteraceae bacterium]|nr:MAG: hydrogenase maturation [Geobacteraceae bacterium]
MKSVIIGMGNPLLTDDGVGASVVRQIEETLRKRIDVDCLELYTGGIRLMEAMVGYDRAYVVDAMVTGEHEPGTVHSFSPTEFITTKNTVSSHDTDLSTALEMGKLLGMKLPDEVKIWGVEAREVETFGEELTEGVAAAVPQVVEHILQDLNISDRRG